MPHGTLPCGLERILWSIRLGFRCWFLGRFFLGGPGSEVGSTEGGLLGASRGPFGSLGGGLPSYSSESSGYISGNITFSLSSDSQYSMSMTTAWRGRWFHSSLYCGVAAASQAWIRSNSLKNMWTCCRTCSGYPDLDQYTSLVFHIQEHEEWSFVVYLCSTQGWIAFPSPWGGSLLFQIWIPLCLRPISEVWWVSWTPQRISRHRWGWYCVFFPYYLPGSVRWCISPGFWWSPRCHWPPYRPPYTWI